MENGRSYYSTYRFYDDQERRLAIFGEEIGEDKLKVTIITCSKKDQFSKKAAEQAYNDGYISKFRSERYLDEEDNKHKIRLIPITIPVKPLVFTIPIGDNKPKFSLIQYCKENLWQLRHGKEEIEFNYLTKDGDVK